MKLDRLIASKQVEMVFGADFILRVNIDGVCVLRVWLDQIASKQVEMVFGADFILRVNIDGVCVLRVWLDQGCDIAIRNDLPHHIGLQKAEPC